MTDSIILSVITIEKDEEASTLAGLEIMHERQRFITGPSTNVMAHASKLVEGKIYELHLCNDQYIPTQRMYLKPIEEELATHRRSVRSGLPF